MNYSCALNAIFHSLETCFNVLLVHKILGKSR